MAEPGAITSGDVRPAKRGRPKKEAADVNLEVVDKRNDMVQALEAYEGALKEMSGGKVWLKMERDNASFTSEHGVKFTREHPFQQVDEDEVPILLRQNFRKAYPDEIKEFYDA